MAAMTTVLTEFSNNGNSRTSTYGTHTALKPKLVIEKRRVPEGNQTVSEYTVKVVYATTDAAGAVLPQKGSFDLVSRFPILGTAADQTAALAIIRDIVAGDEFANSILTQEWLK